KEATDGLGEDSARIVNDVSTKMDAEMKKNEAELKRLSAKWQNANLSKTYDKDIASIKARLKDLESKSYSNVAAVTNGFAQLKTVESQITDLQHKLSGTQRDFDRDYTDLKRNSADFSRIALSGYKEAIQSIKSDAISVNSLVNLYLLQPVREVIPQYVGLYQRFVEWKTKRNETKTEDTAQVGPPTLWIKQIVLTGEGKGGQQISGEVRHLSSDQYFIGESFVVNIVGKGILTKTGSFVLQMEQAANQNGFPISLSGDLQNIPIYKMNLYRERGKTVRIVKGSSKVFFKSALLPAGRIVGTVTAYGRDLDFYTDGFENKQSVEGIMVDVLSKTDSAKVTIQVSGRITEPDIKASTDIGDQIGEGVTKMVSSIVNEERRRVKKRLDDMSQTYSRNWKTVLNSQFSSLDKEMDGLRTQASGLTGMAGSTKGEINKKLESAKRAATEAAAKDALKSLPNLNL
ncbi:MAG: hypothetical protein O3A01_08420, partial [bacterium]|nr:hypothetical protein [bacterium]